MTDQRARRPFAALIRVPMLAVPLVIALALAGCVGQPGAAAIVDGEVISEAYLSETVADLAAFSDAPPVWESMTAVLLRSYVPESRARIREPMVMMAG